MKKILFIAHETTRTGAPFMLLYFLQWLKKHNKVKEIHILFLQPGDLLQDFISLSDKSFFYYKAHKEESYLLKAIYKVFNFFGKKSNYKSRFIKKIATHDYDVIYGNCAPTLNVALKIKQESIRAKLLLHVHELEVVLKMHLSKKNNELGAVDTFIAASNLVKHNLVDNWGVDKGSISVVYECSILTKNYETLKKEAKTFIVGASGSVQWRKGDDVFLQVARYIAKHYPEADIKFLWVGANNKSNIIEEDLRKLKLINRVDFVGQQKNPEQYYKEFSMFLMTSREDPFPLVCIEMAHLKKPIICFESATGTQEVLRNGGGKIVPYLDIEAMAESIMAYYKSPDILKKDGEKAKELFAPFMPKNIAPQIYKHIENLTSKSLV